MERLTSSDSLFLDIERSGPSVAVGSVVRIAGPTPTPAAVRKFIASRLDKMPRFRQRVQASRSKVRHSKWVEVDPNLAYHVKSTKIKPGESVDPVVSKIMEQPMDRDQPLWDLMIVGGYSTEEWTMIIRLHHTIADGQGAVILLGELLDVDPAGHITLAKVIASMTAPKEEHTEEAETVNAIDAATTKMVRNIEKGFDVLGKFISTYPDTVRSLISMLPHRQSTLTGEVSDERKWIGNHYSLAAVKEARKAYKGVTINDMVLASVAVGFTKLLESRGEPVEGRTLRAVMPVSLRRNLDANNQVSLLPAPLPLGDLDPVQRMRQIRESTKHSKRSMLPVIADAMVRTSDKITPAPLTEFVVNKSGTSTGYFSETLITNVPGPTAPMYFMGHEILGSIPIIPIEGGMQIIVGITSYVNDLNIGITGDGQKAQDVDVLMAGIKEGFDQLVELAATKKAAKAARVAAAKAS